MLSHYRSVSAALDGPKHKSRPIAELHSLRPCFLAQFRYGPQRGNNALLLYSEDDLLDFVAQCKRRNYEIYRVGLLSPGYINETGVWQLGDLESVWEADEPNAAVPAIVYVLSTGVLLVKSFWFTPENELGKRKQLASFPVGT